MSKWHDRPRVKDARIRFSEKFCRHPDVLNTIHGHVQFLARIEFEDYESYWPCHECPYIGKSNHEMSAHARLHAADIESSTANDGRRKDDYNTKKNNLR